VIERDWYTLGRWGLDAQGRCAKCGTAIAGVFEARPGNWGARRMPVRMTG
jgi:pyruvate formate lyase activating enzyme